MDCSQPGYFYFTIFLSIITPGLGYYLTVVRSCYYRSEKRGIRAGQVKTPQSLLFSPRFIHYFWMTTPWIVANLWLVSVLSHSVMSDSLWPHGLLATRLLCGWNSPGKNTGVDCHALLLEIFPTQESNPGLPHCRQFLYCNF